MGTDTKIIIGVIVTTVLLLVGASIVLSHDNSPKREELGTAGMSIDKTVQDLGNMKVSDERTATFTITNTSQSILRIWGVSTSCNCTFASITINGKTTGEFNMSMHMGDTLKNWIGEVPVGQAATLAVTYRPSVMPVTGPVSRQVTFSTNDPKHPEGEVSITATVL